MPGLNDLISYSDPKVSPDELLKLFDRTNADASTGTYSPRISADTVQTPVHKGLFGIKGTARDILGILGDALLAFNGRGPQYGPRRQQERVEDAMTAYDFDPEGALRKLMQVDPEAGIKLQNSRNLDLYRQGVLTNQEARIEAAARKQEDLQLQRGMGVMASIARAGDSKEMWPKTAAMMRETASNLGIDLPYDIPDEYDPEFSKLATASGMKPADLIRTDTQAFMARKRGENIDSQIQDRATRTGAYVSGVANQNANRDANTQIRRADTGSKMERRSTQNRVDTTKNHVAPRKPPVSSAGAPPGKGYRMDGKIWVPDGKGGWQ